MNMYLCLVPCLKTMKSCFLVMKHFSTKVFFLKCFLNCYIIVILSPLEMGHGKDFQSRGSSAP